MTPTLRVVPAPPTPPPAGLPARPRLHPDRAVLWRSPDRVQIGLDPARAVVLDGLTAPLAALVRALDGSRGYDELVAEAVAHGCATAAPGELLATLHDAGLLAGAMVGTDLRAPSSERSGSYVLVHGAGRVGVATACLLAGAGVGRVHVAAQGPVAAADVGTGLRSDDVGRPRADAAAAALERAAPGVVTTRATRRRPDLVVLADTEVIDPVLALRLVEQGRPHLPVQVREGVGLLGPLVLPGQGPCLRCQEVERAGEDPGWPRLAGRLVRRVSPAAVTAAAAVAALAAEAVLSLLDGPPGPCISPAPALLGTVLELDAHHGTLRRRRARAHPECPCGAAASPAVLSA